jgi:hypothetical protein
VNATCSWYSRASRESDFTELSGFRSVCRVNALYCVLLKIAVGLRSPKTLKTGASMSLPMTPTFVGSAT